MEISSPSRGTDDCWQQPSLWSVFRSSLCLLWVTRIFAWTYLSLHLVHWAHLVSFYLFMCMCLGNPGFWFCSEGAGAAPTETLWEETKPSSWSHTGEATLWTTELFIIVKLSTRLRFYSYSCVYNSIQWTECGVNEHPVLKTSCVTLHGTMSHTADNHKLNLAVL